jgi:hypothetical protein
MFYIIKQREYLSTMCLFPCTLWTFYIPKKKREKNYFNISIALICNEYVHAKFWFCILFSKINNYVYRKKSVLVKYNMKTKNICEHVHLKIQCCYKLLKVISKVKVMSFAVLVVQSLCCCDVVFILCNISKLHFYCCINTMEFLNSINYSVGVFQPYTVLE